MKKTFFALAILFLISACKNNTTEVLLNYTNLNGTVAKQGNFNFNFDEDLAPDSILGLWQRADYIKFEPEIKGEYKWISSKELVFSPAQTLNPATAFTATVTDAVLKFSKDKKLNVEKIAFQTAELQVSQAKAFWTKSTSNEDQVKLTVEFSESINIEDADKLVDIKLNGENVTRESVTTGVSYYLSYILPNVKKSDDDFVFDINLQKGLKPNNGSIATKDPVTKHALLSSPFHISVSDVAVEHDGSKGTLKVICSQKVKSKDLVKFIEIKPKVTYDIEHNENGFSISSSKFLATEKYTLTIKEGMQGDIGGKLKSAYNKDITFGQLKPEIKFEKDKAFYLSADGNRNIEAKITSIGKVNVVISKVYENNLITSRSQNSWFNTSSNYYDNYYNDYYDDYYYYNSSNQVVQDVVFEKTYNASDFPKVGGSTLFKLDFADKLKDYKGIYHIDVRSEDDRWIRDSRFVSVSDLGLIVKNGQNYMSVFVNSIKTTVSKANTKIKVYGQNNQLAGEGTTDSDGYAKITLINEDISGFSPTLVTATLGSDFNVLMLRDTRVKTSDFDLGGFRNTANGLQTFIYPERDLYRPGETVHFAGIVRNNDWVFPGKLPVKIEVRTPNGKLLKSMKKTLNAEGSFEAEFETSKNNLTGNYIINVSSSNDVFMASKRIQVEEFMPDRIKVATKFDKEECKVGEKAFLTINAQNLFGTPAAGRTYQTEVNFKNTYMYPKGFERYNFYISNLKNNFEPVSTEGKTDAQGNATENIIIPTKYANMGKLNAVVYSTVFDETNRPVNRRDVLKVSTQDAYFGIGNFDYYVGTNQQLDFPLVSLDKDDKILKGTKVLVKVIKHEYRTVLKKSGSYYTYESQKEEKVVLDKKITLNGKETVSYTPSLSGRYEIRISSQDAPESYVSNRFYAYSWGSTSTTSFEVNNEGKIDMEFDKESYEVGDNATVLFKTPFDGRLLVTVEREDVLQHFYLNTDNRAAEFSFLTTDQFIPNAYITATLFKEHKQSDFPLTVAHGFKSLDVKKSSRELKLDISAVENSRSRTKQTIKVKTTPNAKVTIAVVDEGILQISGFTTPNPYGFFYQNRALQVNSYDIYPFLFKEISADNAGAGGDGFDLSKRVNPMQNERVKLVSFWSGIVNADGSGNVSFDVDIPQFSGSLRIMAVAHKGNAFGSAESNIIVADPIVMSSSIPRFFSPGDTALITTTLTNTTEKSANSKTTIVCSGPLEVISDAKQSASINSKGEKQVSFKVYVKNELGVGKIRIACNALGEEFLEETDISIRPATSLLKETGSGVIAAGNKETIDLNVANFIENSTDYKVVISKNPMIEFAKDLDYLVRYPYGCSEQTVSAVFPQVYLADITKAMYKKNDKAADVTNNINAAITKLKMRQIYNGGLTMWDNGGQESWWITAYASHFLLEAKSAGYNVDQVFIDKMLEYLKNKLKSKETVNYYYDQGKTKRIAPKEVSYSLYVLALAGKPDLSLMNYYKSKTELFTKDCEYQLSAAYALAGDKAKAKEILPAVYSPLLSDKQFGGSFYSPIRDEALALNALLEIDPTNEQIGIMSAHLSKKLKNTRYINTQERIFSLLALGKIAKKANESTIAVNVNSGGTKLMNYSSGISTFRTKDIKNGKIELEVKGSGNLYYFFETEGISKDGSFKEEDSFLKVRKTFYDRKGNLITTNTFKPNDLIVVKLSIQTVYNTKVENVAITDILPACFEIENPRTDEIPGTEWIKDQSRADFTDIRDDRINLFDDIYTYNSKPRNYYYVVRVVSKGTYRMGPVSADAMYNGEYHSYSGGGTITVK